MASNSSNILIVIELVNSSTITFEVKRDKRINHLIYKSAIYLELSPYCFQLKYLGLIDIIANKYFHLNEKGEKVLNLNTKGFSKLEAFVDKLKESDKIKLKLVILKDNNKRDLNHDPIKEYKDVLYCSCKKEVSIINRINQKLACKGCSENSDLNSNFFKIEKIIKSLEMENEFRIKRKTTIEIETYFSAIKSYFHCLKTDLNFIIE